MTIPSWQLYGEASPFPDILHVERIADRAAGLDWRIAPHRHLQLHQFFLIRAGQATVTVDGRMLHPVPPQVISIPAGAVHGFVFAAGTDGFVLSLPVGDFPELFGPAAPVGPLLSRPFMAAATGPLIAAFDGLAGGHATAEPLRRLRLRAAAVLLACAVADLVPTDAAPDPLDPRVPKLESLARRHLADGWPMAAYARELALSERQLRRICLTATGLSAQDFVAQVRLNEACRLLAYTRMQVQQVAFALGHDDPAYFARVFRRGTGLSPLEFRARLDGVSPPPTGAGVPEPSGPAPDHGPGAGHGLPRR